MKRASAALPLPSPSSFARCAPSVTEEVQTSHQNVRSNIIITLSRMFAGNVCLVIVNCARLRLDELRVRVSAVRNSDVSADVKESTEMWPEHVDHPCKLKKLS